MVGVALIQAILVGIALLIAGVPWAGAFAAIVLVLGIAQVPAVIVTLPAIAWVWSRGGDSTGEAIIYTALLLVSGMADNVLKPLMLGRGVDVPMPVILVGALGGMATGGIIGTFVGATLLALGWQISTGGSTRTRTQASCPEPKAIRSPGLRLLNYYGLAPELLSGGGEWLVEKQWQEDTPISESTRRPFMSMHYRMMISTRRFCGSRTPGPVGTSRCVSPKP